MRIAILTTGAVRRRYFVERLQTQFPVARVYIETRDPKPPFPTDHPLDSERKARERDVWYDGTPPAFESVAETEYHESLNAPAAISSLRKLNPDVVLVYGTGKLNSDLIAACPENLFNFHNGDPEDYRGLDCHLWPLYHRDFEALRMTLHRIDADLDTGDIVDRRPVPLSSGMPLADLRRAACEVTVEMALDALSEWSRSGRLETAPQRRKGRYYSYMPAVLKDVCQRNFERHTATL